MCGGVVVESAPSSTNGLDPGGSSSNGHVRFIQLGLLELMLLARACFA